MCVLRTYLWMHVFVIKNLIVLCVCTYVCIQVCVCVQVCVYLCCTRVRVCVYVKSTVEFYLGHQLSQACQLPSSI